LRDFCLSIPQRTFRHVRPNERSNRYAEQEEVALRPVAELNRVSCRA
jgi:hypothetical protein